MAQENDNKFIIDFIAPQLSLPLGDFKQTNGFGYGGRIGVQYAVMEKFRLTAHFGAIHYNGKDNPEPTSYPYPDYWFMPLTAGAKYFFTYGLFAGAQAGPVFRVVKSNKSGSFTYAPMVGYEFGDGPFYDISLRYDSYVATGGTLNALTMSVTYQF